MWRYHIHAKIYKEYINNIQIISLERYNKLAQVNMYKYNILMSEKRQSF